MAEESERPMGGGRETAPGIERPRVLEGKTIRIRTGHGSNLFVTVNRDGDGRPIEVFAWLGKAGSCDRAYLEAISRLISLVFRLGGDVDAVVDELRGITCHPLVRGAKSPVDGIALALDGKLGEESES